MADDREGLPSGEALAACDALVNCRSLKTVPADRVFNAVRNTQHVMLEPAGARRMVVSLVLPVLQQRANVGKRLVFAIDGALTTRSRPRTGRHHR